MKRCRYFLPAGAMCVLALLACPVRAGTFANIAIDDAYDDWTGIPVGRMVADEGRWSLARAPHEVGRAARGQRRAPRHPTRDRQTS